MNTSSTPKVQYARGGAGSQLTAVMYPHGRVVHYAYNAGADAALGRVSTVAADDSSGGVGAHVADYQYLGPSTVVNQADANGVSLSDSCTADRYKD